jgi:radical SAM-linked protein
MRRFRLMFGKGEEVRYISHLDLMRTWERVLRRAGLRLAHSQGFNPRPRLVFAAPLPVGVTSEAEIVDVIVEDEIDAAGFAQRVRSALPPGISLAAVSEVGLEAPAVMAQVATADYVVAVQATAGREEALERIAEFLQRASVPYDRTRKKVTKRADMRPAVVELGIVSWPERRAISMRLRIDQEGAAVRPEEVLCALDNSWAALRVHRIGVALTEGPDHAA